MALKHGIPIVQECFSVALQLTELFIATIIGDISVKMPQGLPMSALHCCCHSSKKHSINVQWDISIILSCRKISGVYNG